MTCWPMSDDDMSVVVENHCMCHSFREQWCKHVMGACALSKLSGYCAKPSVQGIGEHQVIILSTGATSRA